MTSSLLDQEVGVVADLLAAGSVLAWDMRTMMPAGGVVSRGEQLATIAQLARERLLGGSMARALDAAERDASLSLDNDQRLVVQAVRTAIDRHRRIPSSLVRQRNVLRAEAQHAWAHARNEGDFSIFAPLLSRTIELAREQAEALGYVDHPHDALLDQFEPGSTWRTLSPIFDALRRGLKPLRDRALMKPAPAALPTGPYPVELQRSFGRMLAEGFGYDFARGRLDPTVHPFELAMTRNDVRITARYSETAIDIGLKATMHETGHGLYEQNIDPSLTRTALGLDLIALSSSAGASLGVHESQSRLWENHVGRSRAFWSLTYPKLQAFFSPLRDISLAAFYRAFNAVRGGPIRTEADELSYDFHIIMRTELERALVDGSLTVADLPAAWNEAMQRDLDIVVTGDRDGVLQDIHWSMGQFGSFCSYTVGNVLAAQVWNTVATDEVTRAIEQGDFRPLRAALTEKIYRHGRRYGAGELIERATGAPLDPRHYISYLSSKYEALYELD